MQNKKASAAKCSFTINMLKIKVATMRKTKAKMGKSFQTLKLLNILKSVYHGWKDRKMLTLQCCTLAAPGCLRRPPSVFSLQEKLTCTWSPAQATFSLRFNLEMKTVTKNCPFYFDFLCCIEVYNAKWNNSEYLNKSAREVKISVFQCLGSMHIYI